MTNEKPNCFMCTHRREVPGSTHSRCAHPNIGETDPMDEVMAIFASVGRVEPRIHAAAIMLNVTGDATGIRRGWFNWPFNFDPTWLRSCNGFENKEAKKD